MRTLFYHGARHSSGSTRAFAIAARGFAAMGHPVAVMCIAGTPVEAMFQGEGIDVIALEPGVNTAEAWRLRKILKEKFIEVVFVHTDREQAVATSALRFADRGAVIRRIPAGATVTAARLTKGTRPLFAMDADRTRAGLGDAGFVAPLGVDVAVLEGARQGSRQMLGIADATRLIACVVDDKSGHRVTTALRTMALLAERHPELRMAVIGRCADQDDMRMHAAALGVTSLVRFLGERADVPRALAAADVGWVAADGDDGAFACLDFMSARIPVIAERSPLLAQFVPDGIAGVHLPQADPSDTASAVARFLADDAQRIAMGNAGHTRAAREFTEAAMVQGFLAAAGAAGDRAAWAGR